LDDQEGDEETNTTATPDSGKPHVSNHFYPWIASVTLDYKCEHTFVTMVC
jgi:hypothetical protein